MEARRRTWWWAYAVGAAVVAAYLWAGYVEGWAWTGLSQPVTLWDWLEGLALPITVGLVPLMLRHRDHLGRRHKRAGLVVVSGFTAIVLAGYLVPWPWTGFTGNTLWDWLSLALLPLVIATSTLWHPPPRWRARHTMLLTTTAVAAVALVLAGYLVPWPWTGFTGNTAWDWIRLLLLPILIPTVVMPRLLDATDDWMSPDGGATNPERSTAE